MSSHRSESDRLLVRLLHTLSHNRFTAGLVRARRRPFRSAVTAVLAVVLAIAWVQGVTRGTLAQAEETRSLESVDISVSSSGAITAVSGTSVSVSADGRRAKTGSETYSAPDVADQLPVRVRTAYRIGDTTGTDLSDLAGYTGRVTIDVFVENLTVKPQTLTYDVAGVSRTRTALVGAPLTLTAATTLDMGPSSVVTAASDAQDVTNGVLSQNSNGGAQIQWAALLAPPQLGASANLRLVVDAVDFKVPELGLSVQAGLVTDPSIQGLMDAAFRTDAGSELTMTTSTIEVLAKVNESLAQAHSIVDRASTTLADNAGTIGSQTLEDLTSSSQNLSSSMQSTGKELEGLSQNLAQTRDSTQSSVAAQLLQVVDTASAILGDTSEPAQAPGTGSTDATGCQVQSGGGDSGGTGNGVYGSVTRVSGLLQAYAQANESCKADIQSQLAEALGSADTSACPKEAGKETTSATCALAAAQQQVTEAIASLGSQADAVTAALQPEVRADVLGSSKTLGNSVTGVETALDELGKPDEPDKPDGAKAGTGDLSAELQALTAAVDALTPNVDTVVKTLDDIHSSATTAQANNTTARGQITAAARDLCTEIASAKDPALLQQARARLTSEPCPGGAAADAPDETPADSALTTQSTNLEQVVTASDTKTEGSDTKTNVDALRTAVTDVRSARDAVALAVNGDPNDPKTPSLSGSLTNLRTAVSALRTDYDALNDAVTKLDTDQTAAANSVTTAFKDMQSRTTAAVSESVSNQIRLIGAQAAVSQHAVGASFDAATASMRGQAESLTSDSAQTIQNQKTQVQGQAAQSSSVLSAQIGDSLNTMTQGLEGSVVDIEAARSMLMGDLDRVMLDVGSLDGPRTGLVGIMASSAALTGSAGYQIAAANQTIAAHEAVRAQDMEGILLEQALVKASLDALSRLRGLATPRSGADQSTTIYSYRVGGPQ